MVAPVMLTADEVAARISRRPGELGLTGASWRRYVYGGKAPKADEVKGRTPLWRASTVDRWAKGEDERYPRPGRGYSGGRPWPKDGEAGQVTLGAGDSASVPLGTVVMQP